MKRNVIIVGILCLIIVISPLLTGPVRKENLDVWDKRVTFVSPFSDNRYWEKICIGAMEEGKQHGIDVKCISSADNDEKKVSTNFESAVYSDVDGIVAYGVDDSQVFLEVLEKAWNQNVPVVLVDSNVHTDKKLCYVGTDNYQSGWNAGERMAEDCKEQGNILIMVSSMETDNQQERVAGFMDALEEYPKIKIIGILEGSSNMMQGQKLLTEALEKYDDIDGIFCAEGITSYAALYVMKGLAFHKNPIPVIVYEYSGMIKKGLEEGYVSTAIVQNPEQMGQLAIRAMAAYLEDGTLPEENVFTETKQIRRNNLQEGEPVLDWSGLVEWHYY